MDMLHQMGFKRDGTQVMQSGITGERYKVPIFIGPTFYQRLKHNAEDKIHARGRGRTCFLTRQPNEGRANGGALRVGEMEKDAGMEVGMRMLAMREKRRKNMRSCLGARI